jgi:amino acid permease
MPTILKNKYFKFTLTFLSVLILSTFIIDIKNILHLVIVLIVAIFASITSYKKQDTSGYNSIIIFESGIVFIFILLWLIGINQR